MIRSNNANQKEETKIVPVLDMSCASCAASVESMLSSQEGVHDASVNFANNTATIHYNPSLTDLPQLKKAIQSIGYDLMIDSSENAAENLDNHLKEKNQQLKRKTIGAALLTTPMLVLGMMPYFMHWKYSNYIQWILATPFMIFFGQQFFIDAWKQMLHRKANMNTLVALSTGVAYLYSIFITLSPMDNHENHVYFESVAVVITFILLGRYLEEKAKRNTSSAIQKLIGLQPKQVTIIQTNGNEVTKNIAEIAKGDQVVARPGDKIAVDGSVISGESYVDESMLTGEPIATHKGIDTKVFAGTINQNGHFIYRAEKIGASTFLSQIIKTVQEAQGSKAPVQKKVDKIAGIFVPIVIVIALVAFLCWYFIDKEMPMLHALNAFVTVLIIACPCALGLATPTAIMVGMGKGAENGILLKDAEALDKAHLMNVIVFDKTGTITDGKPSVTKIDWLVESFSTWKEILYSIEKKSDHPLAIAIVNFLKKENINSLDTVTIDNVAGKGMTATYHKKNYYVGSINFAKEIITQPEVFSHIISQSETTTVLFFNDEKILAIVHIQDQIKPSALTVIYNLRSKHIQTHLLTGDSEKVAQYVAQKISIDQYKAEVLPQDKSNYIKSLQSKGFIVGMVGDGINDSAALAQSDIGIAMELGSDIAIESAEVTITNSNLEKIPQLLKLSKLTSKTIQQNLFWAFVYNVIGIPIAAGILYPINGFLLNPMIAGACMAFSSVSVISNSLLLKFKKI